jgi:hypothetical protein
MIAAARHWHGYFWTGTITELKDEALRRPSDPGFLRSSLPPIQTGHYLLRRGATTQDLTWVDVDKVIEWMAASYQRHPPMIGEAGFPAINGVAPLASDVGLEVRREGARETLINGVDSFWMYYTGRSGGMVATVAICCPHTHFPEIPCPMSPRT